MDHNPIQSRLRDLAFTQGLGPLHLDQMAAIAAPVEWAAGVTVFREGEIDSVLYVVEEGRVAIQAMVPARERVTILTVGPGEVFGWSSLFQQWPKTASARTTEPTKAFALDALRLRTQCDADPRLGYILARRILGVVAERLKATRMQLLDIYGH
jgi:CRP-like cAMP-binding protein